MWLNYNFGLSILILGNKKNVKFNDIHLKATFTIHINKKIPLILRKHTILQH